MFAGRFSISKKWNLHVSRGDFMEKRSVESPADMWIKLGDRFGADTTASEIAVLTAQG